MGIITLNTSAGVVKLHCYKNAFKDNIYSIIKGREIFLLTDTNVYKIYKDLIDDTFKCPMYILKAGEKSKNFSSLKNILKKMTESGLKRNALFIALGGGVVGDIGGLCAGLYMRGIEIVQIPTTLLSQVDSSVGGKTAIDFNGVKNNIGMFYQPKTVLIDSMFLQTLPKKQIRCGLGEIIKTAALDSEIFEIIKNNTDKLFNLDFLEKITFNCIKHKADVVEKDEKETNGLRKTLNLGHSTGHALEIHYKNKSHGEYVLYGMLFEMEIAKRLGLIDTEYKKQLKDIIYKVLTSKYFENIQNSLSAALLDKKNEQKNKISLIVPINIGKVTEINIDFNDYAQLIGEINNENKS